MSGSAPMGLPEPRPNLRPSSRPDATTQPDEPLEPDPTSTTSRPAERCDSLTRSLPESKMEGPYSARFPSSSLGETSRRTPAFRGAADERVAHRAQFGAPCRRAWPLLGAAVPVGRQTTERLDQGGSRSALLAPPTPVNSRPSAAASCHRVESKSTESIGMAGESTTYVHRPVMVREIEAIFGPVPPGVVVDATLGGGGHAAALLGTHHHLSVIGLDQDGNALEAAATRLRPFGDRVTLRRSRFDRMREVVDELGDPSVVGVLFDLGVSSPQLDRAERGFSYRHDGPLDMRMDQRQPVTAADIVNGYDEAELVRVLRDLGDERFAGRIAKAILHARPIESTGRLADVVRDAIPAAARRRGGHPAKRTFQALRIEVNQELTILAGAIDDAIDLLVPDGRLAVLAYHSGEDRIVKSRLLEAETGGCVCPPGLPCVCGAQPKVKLLRRGARKPSAQEIEANPRAESARLRAAQRLEAAA